MGRKNVSKTKYDNDNPVTADNDLVLDEAVKFVKTFAGKDQTDTDLDELKSLNAALMKFGDRLNVLLDLETISQIFEKLSDLALVSNKNMSGLAKKMFVYQQDYFNKKEVNESSDNNETEEGIVELSSEKIRIDVYNEEYFCCVRHTT